MKKLKTKYKWRERKEHFSRLNFQRDIFETISKSWNEMNKKYAEYWHLYRDFTGATYRSTLLSLIKESDCGIPATAPAEVSSALNPEVSSTSGTTTPQTGDER